MLPRGNALLAAALLTIVEMMVETMMMVMMMMMMMVTMMLIGNPKSAAIRELCVQSRHLWAMFAWVCKYALCKYPNRMSKHTSPDYVFFSFFVLAGCVHR